MLEYLCVWSAHIIFFDKQFWEGKIKPLHCLKLSLSLKWDSSKLCALILLVLLNVYLVSLIWFATSITLHILYNFKAVCISKKKIQNAFISLSLCLITFYYNIIKNLNLYYHKQNEREREYVCLWESVCGPLRKVTVSIYTRKQWHKLRKCKLHYFYPLSIYFLFLWEWGSSH